MNKEQFYKKVEEKTNIVLSDIQKEQYKKYFELVTHFPRNMKLYHPLSKPDSLYALLMISNKDTLHDKGTGMTHATFS